MHKNIVLRNKIFVDNHCVIIIVYPFLVPMSTSFGFVVLCYNFGALHAKSPTSILMSFSSAFRNCFAIFVSENIKGIQL